MEISALASEAAKWSSMKRRRTEKPDITRRANRAVRCVLDGALSAGRQALVPSWRHPEKRPKIPREPLPDRIKHHQPECLVDINEQLFAHILRTARRGAAVGPSGMTSEHLRRLLDSDHDMSALSDFANSFARWEVLAEVVAVLRMGRMTALRKPMAAFRGSSLATCSDGWFRGFL